MQRRFLLLSFFILLIAFPTLTHASGRRRASNGSDRIEGVITALAADQATIRTSRDERQVQLQASTLVKIDGKTVNASALQVGDKVEVQTHKDANGTISATSIEVETDEDVTGVVKAVSATTLSVDTKNGVMDFTLTPDTVVLLHGQHVTVAAITTGLNVTVHWSQGADDALVARVVEVHTDLVETEGNVTAVGTSSLTVHTGSGTDVTITTNADTAVRSGRHELTLSQIAVGNHVHVKSLKNTNGSLLAVLIEVQNPNDLTRIEGEVTAISAGSITVKKSTGDEVTVAINADTIVRGDDHTLSVTDIKVGDKVEIDAAQNGTSLTAVRIEVEHDDQRYAEVKGTIKAINGSVLTIDTGNGKTVDVSITSTTVIRNGDKVGAVSDLKTGDAVEIVAKRNADGSLEALYIEIQGGGDGSQGDQFVEIQGKISSVDASSIKVTTRSGDVTATIDANTVVKIGGKTATVADLKVGMLVEVKAAKQADTTLLARTINAQNAEQGDPLVVILKGTITAVDASSIKVATKSGDVTAAIDSTTLVFNGNRKASVSDLKSGMRVEVGAVRRADGTLLAKVIKVDNHGDN
ncbi:MAG: DUF5666 domain-containing protein [Thermoanaerobaculia bacterium]